MGWLLQGLGACIVLLGLLLGLSFNNLKVELTYLAAGGVVFLVGSLLRRGAK